MPDEVSLFALNFVWKESSMCFRPADVAASKTCESCGATVNAVGGFFPPKCPTCGKPFEGDGGAPGTPGAPGAPKAPGNMPGAPKVPGTMPGAPKVPGSK